MRYLFSAGLVLALGGGAVAWADPSDPGLAPVIVEHAVPWVHWLQNLTYIVSGLLGLRAVLPAATQPAAAAATQVSDRVGALEARLAGLEHKLDAALTACRASSASCEAVQSAFHSLQATVEAMRTRELREQVSELRKVGHGLSASMSQASAVANLTGAVEELGRLVRRVEAQTQVIARRTGTTLPPDEATDPG